MRIASGGIQHETNTFSRIPTTLADFERDSQCGPEFSAGETLFQLYRGTGTIHGGLIEAAEESEVELLPLLNVRAQPSGAVTREAFETLTNLFLERLQAVLPVDGLALDLHGAMVTEGDPDGEGAFLERVRELVGPDLPIVTTLDLHANITPRMAQLSNVLIGFDTYPHVDMGERGAEALRLLARMIRGDVQPRQAFRQLPLITLPPKQCTLREPMHSLMAEVHLLESRPEILTATVAMGFPFADIPDAGVSVLVTANEDQAIADRAADELAGRLWNLRDELQPELTTIEECIRFTNEEAKGLVLFADGSDNPGGGAPCDGTVALQALLDADFQGGVVGILYDPETVDQAHAAGVGATIEARIGAKTDDAHGTTIVTSARVRNLSDGVFIHRGPMMQGLAGQLGRTATLVIGGVEVVLCSNRRQLLDAEMLRICGITPEDRRLIVVKSAVHFRAHLGPLAAHIFDADTPGIHRPDFSRFDYQRLRRPIYPLDSQVKYP
ncbi:MAG: M81 family metallopeptidase [Planctomycetaceae bacterium]|nr:M81 family metallopeptidase [Planctomycetaceae bacterium]